jgi:hypothetical protein
MGGKSSKPASEGTGSQLDIDQGVAGTKAASLNQSQAEASARNKEAFSMLAEPRGVSVAFLQQFLQEHDDDKLTAREVVEKYILPETKGKTKEAYTSLLAVQHSNAQPLPQTGAATIFVSHCWDAVFAETIRMVLAYAQEQAGKGVAEDKLYFWIDVFCNNQHASYQLDKEWSVQLSCRFLRHTLSRTFGTYLA